MIKPVSMMLLVAALCGPAHSAHISLPLFPIVDLSTENYKRQNALDREELVRPAAKDFRPVAGKKVSLRLKVEKTDIRLGDPIRYSLELFNEGSETFVVLDHDGSFFKTGRLASMLISLDITDPDGAKQSIIGKRSPHRLGYSPSAKEIEEHRARKKDYTLTVELAPGETLRTRGDAPGERFKSLSTHYRFRPGKYELQATLNPMKPEARSNSVSIAFRP